MGKRNELRRMVDSKRRALVDDAMRTGTVSKSALEELESLDTLANTLDRTVEHSRIAALLLAAAIAVALLVMAATDVDSAAIDLDVQASSVRFTVADTQVVIDALQASSLRVSPVKRLDLPPASDKAPETVDGSSEPFALSYAATAAAAGHQRGAITLDALTVAHDAGVRVSADQAATGRLELSIEQDEPLEVRAAVEGAYELRFQTTRRVSSFAAPVPLKVATSGKVPVAIALTSVSKQNLVAGLAVSSLSLVDNVDIPQRTGTLVLDRGTISGGRLGFTEFKDRTVELRSRQVITFDGLAGYVDILELTAEGLHVHFTGRTARIERHSGNVSVSLMPTVFEWVSDRHLIWALWTAGVSVFGVVSLFWTWWRRT